MLGSGDSKVYDENVEAEEILKPLSNDSLDEEEEIWKRCEEEYINKAVNNVSNSPMVKKKKVKKSKKTKEYHEETENKENNSRTTTNLNTKLSTTPTPQKQKQNNNIICSKSEFLLLTPKTLAIKSRPGLTAMDAAGTIFSPCTRGNMEVFEDLEEY